MLVTGMNREELMMKMMSRVMITMMITMLTLGSRKSNNLAMILLKKKQKLHIASEHQMTMVINVILHRPASQRKQPK